MEYINKFYETYKNNVFSQNGEDGIIEEIFNRLKITNGWCCEFGAWDGQHLSNTFNLVQKGFQAVYIEGDELKYKDLLKTCETYKNITPIKKFVDINENTLDSILSETNIPENFELLSVDIDSSDYHVWKSLIKYRPIVVIIEINSSVDPFHRDWIQTPGTKYKTTSFMPMYNLGIQKGYTFICHTGNMIFVRNDYASKLNIEPPKHYVSNFRRIWLSSNI